MGKKAIKIYESFIKGYDENRAKGYFLEVDVEYPKNCSVELRSTELHSIFIAISHFYLKERKSKNVISLFVTCKTKKTMLFT